MSDPMISDDDAKQLFAYESEVVRLREVWLDLKGQTKDAKDEYDEARERLEGFAHRLRESHPLFDGADEDYVADGDRPEIAKQLKIAERRAKEAAC